MSYILQDKDLAEDVAQEAFIKLCQTPPNNPEKLGGWLFRVATNMAYNLLRSEKKRLLREARVQAEKYGDDSAEDLVIRKEKLEMIQNILHSLNERDRICLIMKYSGFSYDEISVAAGIKRVSVGTVIARAQSRFKNKLLEVKGIDSGVL